MKNKVKKTSSPANPKQMSKGLCVYTRTIYGSYIDMSLTSGMAQQKNAMSYKELIESGFKPTVMYEEDEIKNGTANHRCEDGHYPDINFTP